MFIDDTEYLQHYGTPRRSGRYPWGSGGDAPRNSRDFLSMVDSLKKKGLSEKEISEGFAISMVELRAAKSVATAEKKAADTAAAQRFKDKGMANSAIGERLGVSEATVRNLLAPGAAHKADVLAATVSLLKDQVDSGHYIDVGKGTENYLNVSPERLKVALAVMKQDGYEVITNIPVNQPGTGNTTKMKVLAEPGTTWGDVVKNKGNIRQFNEHLDETGASRLGIIAPKVLNPNRVDIVYASDGGSHADGVMYVRPGVEDVSLGGSRYAQVRVQVGKDRYLKGMAMYKDDLPEGIDVQFNTNKDRDPALSDRANKLAVLKPLVMDKNNPDSPHPDNPFGAVIRRQITKTNRKGEEVTTSVMNLVNEEGDWTKWSKSIASQVLSKQSPRLAREQLDMTFERRKNEFEMISKLTNPTIKKKLLEEFAESADSAAVHLKAANLPNQKWHVILPAPKMKPTEIYAPNYENGTRVSLIRYPHGGTFEIPELVVNNKNSATAKLMSGVKDAVGIHHSVAEHLSGADFDGDTVLVIPNNGGRVKATRPLEGLKNFDPKTRYKEYPGMKVMKNTQAEMGSISNLITDMTIRKASNDELAKAVRHSMVVIDAEKHRLNYKQSAIDNNIKGLKEKYQTSVSGSGGASTLISRAGANKHGVPEFKPRLAQDGGPIDKKTGELVFVPTNRKHWKTGEIITMNPKPKALELTNDAHSLSSGTLIEKLYADHSNKLKKLANQARLDSLNTPLSEKSASAKKYYASEVASLDKALTLARMNAPKERRANILVEELMREAKSMDPTMDYATEKKLKFQALAEARRRTGASKELIKLTDRQWEAIQAGAVSSSKLREILETADMERVKELATPKDALKMTTAKSSRAASMLALGYTRAEVAAQLGVSVTTIDNHVDGGKYA